MKWNEGFSQSDGRILNLIWCAVLVMALSISSVAAEGSIGIRQDVSVLRSDEQGAILELVVPNYDINEKVVDGVVYQSFSIPGWAQTSEVGRPQLPVRNVLLGVPFGAELRVQVIEARAELLPGIYNVLPSPDYVIDFGPMPQDLVEESSLPRKEFVTDTVLYSTDAFYPVLLAEITTDGFMRHQRLVNLALHPFQFNPVSGEIRIYKKLVVQVTFEGLQGEEVASELIDVAYEPGGFGQLLRDNLLNYNVARNWRSGAPTDSAIPTWDPPTPGYKISVNADGMYKMDYVYLQAAGLPVDTLDPRTFQLFDMGSEVAIEVEGEENGQFESGEYILFYGEKGTTKYTDDHVYWLTYDAVPGLRMTQRDGTPNGAPVADSFKNLVRLEENTNYMSAMPGEDELDRWYWEYVLAWVTPAYKDYNITLSSIVSDTYSATLRFPLLGGFDDDVITPDHHIELYVNSQMLVDTWWDGFNWLETEVEFDQSILIEGVNTIRVRLPNDAGVVSDNGDPYDYVFVDWLELEYYDQFMAEADHLWFTYDIPGVWEFQISGFTTDTIDLFDVTNGAAVQRIINGVVEPGYALRFEDTTGGETKYIALTEFVYLAPPAIELDTPSDWQSPVHGADYVVITYQDFVTQAQTLADHRQSRGLRAVVVDVEDVYDEFAYGIFNPHAIRDFLSYTYDQWQPPVPAYVVLLGDGTYDFKDHWGLGDRNYVPPFMKVVDPWTGEIASDNRYVCMDGPDDQLPDMHLGRMAVNTVTQAQAVIDKVISYEQVPPDVGWNQRLLFTADNTPDPAGDFPAASDRLMRDHLPAPYITDTIYLDDYCPPGGNCSAATADLIDAINDGRLLVNYIGHGGTRQWAAEKLLYITDVDTMTNTNKFPMTLAMTCSEGNYAHHWADCLSETLLRAEDKGAVATWSMTGFGTVSGHDWLNTAFFDAIFRDDVREIGPATLAGKLNLWQNGSEPHLLDIALLFGDPALRINTLPAEVGIGKTVTPTTTLQPADVLTYTLTITNVGPATAHHVVITDPLPANVAGAQVVHTDFTLTPRVGTEYAWDVEDLEAGASGTIVITGAVDGSEGVGWFLNQAQIATTAWETGTLPNEASVWSEVVAGPPGLIQASGTPAHISVGGSVSTLEARVTDLWGNLVADGITVDFATDLGSVNPVSDTTSGGLAYTTLTSGPMAAAATVTVTAGEAQTETLVVFTPGPPADVQVSAAPTQITVGGETSLVEAVVEDPYGNSVADGTLVSFGTSAGNVSPTPVATANGVATTTLTSGPQAGVAIVTVQADSVSGFTNVTFAPGPPATVTLEISPTNVLVGGQATLVAAVEDAWGNPVANGTVVELAATLGNVSPVSPTTTGGQASAVFYAGAVAGGASISGTAGAASGQTTLSILPDAPDSLALEAVPTSIALDGAAAISATVTDQYSNLVADGTLVEFDTTLGALNPISGTTMDGVATSTLLAEGLPGLATVSAGSGAASDSTAVKIGEGAAVSITMTATPSSIVADGASTSTIALEVRDAFGQLITQTIPITLETTLGVISPTVTSVVSGEAASQLTSTQTGVALVWAQAGNASGSVTVTLVPGPAAQVSLTVTPPEIQVGGQAGLLVQVADAFGNSVADGTLVTLAASLGSPNPPVVTTTAGTASGVFLAGSAAGSGLVTATSGAAFDAAPVTVLPGPAAAMTLTAEPPSLEADGAAQAEIRATVEDGYGNPVADGTEVTFGATRGTVDPAAAFTLGGEAHTTLTAGTKAGVATVAGLSDPISTTVAVTLTPGLPTTVTLLASPPSIPANGQSQATLAATVSDAFGNAVVDGTWITFSASLGGVWPVTGTTQAGGAQSTLTSSTEASTSTVTATVGTVWDTTAVEFRPGAAAIISLTVEPDTLVADGVSTATVTAMVLDPFGNLVADGTLVNFYETATDDSGLLASDLGSITPISDTTQGGVVRATFQAGTELGVATLAATSGSAIGEAEVALVNGPAQFVILVSTPSAIQADGVSQAVIHAQVKDNWDRAVADGTRVSFGATLGSITPLLGVTVDGWLTATLTAGTQAGVAYITATSGEAEGVGTVVLVAGPPASLTLTAADASLPVGERYTTIVTATVADTWGNRVEDGLPVTFTVDVGSLSAEQAATTGGSATTVYTGTRLGGSAEILAWTVGGATGTLKILLQPYRMWFPWMPKDAVPLRGPYPLWLPVVIKGPGSVAR